MTSKSKHASFLRQKAHRRVLSDGQGARKRKPQRSHRRTNNRHKRAFHDLDESLKENVVATS